jgi:FAD dependent oxidoreductase TIGR03364
VTAVHWRVTGGGLTGPIGPRRVRQVERVVVVGGGVLGMMHALEARQRGYGVIHLEREPVPRGASVRNFGLIWVSGRAPGGELDLALRARARWAQIAAQVPGTGFRAIPSLTLAADDAELGLLEEAASLPDVGLRGYELLTPHDCRAVNAALRGEFTGGLLGTRDAIVEPRQALGALRAHLASSADGYAWLPGREAVELAPYAVRDHTGDWHRGDLVILCPGAAHTGIAGPHLAAWARPPVRRVRLQMMQTAPFPARLTTSLADGDSLRYYPAYDLPGRSRLAPQAPVAAAAKAQLLLVQRLDGGLTVGDTHEYDEPFTFDVDEDAYDHLRERAETLLGTALPRVQRRWAGVYSMVTGDDLYHVSQAAPGVTLVTGPGGRGMTCAPAIAEETFARAARAGPADRVIPEEVPRRTGP